VICRCGKRGCLETGASGSAVHRIFMEKLAQKRVSMLSDKYNRGEQILLEDILEALGQEDVLAIEVMETVGHTLGKAMAGLINLFNPLPHRAGWDAGRGQGLYYVAAQERHQQIFTATRE